MNVMMKKTAVAIAAAVAAVAAYTAISLFRNTPAATTDMEKSKYRIVAHRGGAGLGAENTIECIERGLAAGADAIEVDVHLTPTARWSYATTPPSTAPPTAEDE